MAYQNTPVENGYQVAQQLASFAASVGWTVHRQGEQTDINGSTLYYEVTISASGYPCYVTIAGYSNRIELNGHRGYDSSKRWWEQPDQYVYYNGDGEYTDSYEDETRTICELRVNPILSVHMFGSMSPTPYLYAAIEKEPGYYRHLTIGHLQKFGTAKGGMFWDVSNRRKYNGYHSYPYYHRAPLLNADNADGYNDGPGGFDTQKSDGTPYFNRFGIVIYDENQPRMSTGGHHATELHSVFTASPIAFNARTPLQVPMVFANTYTPFGTAPAMRYVDLTYFEAGDELVVGNETWKLFPWARRTYGVRNSNSDYSGPEYEATHMYGIAYLKD